MKINLKALSEQELNKFVENHGLRPYRAKQLIHWIYKKRATSFDEMTDLSKSFRALLEKTACISSLTLLKKQVSKNDTGQEKRGTGAWPQGRTQKFLFELEDKEKIESVLIPDKNRLTVCISTQVGCAMGCTFCATGKTGLKRNLKAYEIVDQVITVQRIIEQRQIIPPHPCLPDRQAPLLKGDYAITNIVFMGMGEPLHNFSEVIEALWRLTNLLGFSKKRITVSTSGIISKVNELARKGPRINLAVSLNATTDEVRNKLMPVNRKNPLEKLSKACREFPLAPGRRITFEYVMLKGINDSKEDAFRLVRLLKGIRSKVNLIPYNPLPPVMKEKSRLPALKRAEPFKQEKLCLKSSALRTSSEDTITVFQKILLKAGLPAIIRKSRGRDISAACGQLGISCGSN